MAKFIVVVNRFSDVEQFEDNLGPKAVRVPYTRAFECSLSDEEANLIRLLNIVYEVQKVDERIQTSLIPLGLENSEMSIAEEVKIKELAGYGLMVLSQKYKTDPLPGEELSAMFFDQLANITGLPGGQDVDVVIFDGRINPEHPEMKDSSGDTRVKVENWVGYLTNPPSDPPVNFNAGSAADNHGQHVCGTACGLIQGWAKKSNIYNLYVYDSLYNARVAGMKEWHLSKADGNPSVTNHSYGLFWNEATDVRYILSVDHLGQTLAASSMTGVQRAVCSASIGSNGLISFLNLTFAGSGYTNAPDVSFSGGGRETASAVMANGSVYQIEVTNPGDGYSKSSPPSVTFGTSPSGVTATGFCEVDDFGSIDRVVMTNRGSGYTSPPTITFGSPPQGGIQASGTADIASNFISQISVINGGDGHTDRDNFPSIIISGGGCNTDATWGLDLSLASATETSGVLQNGLYKILEKKEFTGSGFRQVPLGGIYSFTPKVSFMHKPGHGPRALARFQGGGVVGIRMIENDKVFASPPEIVFTNGCGFTVDQIEEFGIGMVIQTEVGPDGNPISLLPGEGRHYLTGVPQRSAVTDSLMKDLMDSGVVVSGASGNSNSRVMRPGQIGYEDRFSYLGEAPFKDSPSILDEESEFAPAIFTLDYAKGCSPGAAPGVICVGSLSYTCCPEVKSGYSMSGPRIDFYAPGDCIMSSVHGQATPHPSNPSYYIQKRFGTSMACAQVTGMLACHAEGKSSFSQSEAISFLNSQAKSALSDEEFPYQLRAGTDKVVYFPSLSVELG